MTQLTELNEVINFIKTNRADMLFSFHLDPLVPFLTYPMAKESGFFKDDLVESYLPTTKEYTRENVLADMRDYLAFAYEKALDQRGLSASRSVQKMATWLYMLNDPFHKEVEDYEDYGLANLHRIDATYFNNDVFANGK